MPKDAISQYLERYAEPESAITLPGKTYLNTLVIPVYQEDHEQLLRVWRNLESSRSFLVILVLNSHTADESWVKHLVHQLCRDHPSTPLPDSARLIETPGPDLLLIDRYSAGRTIPHPQGVGLARKIGMDIAVSLMEQSIVLDDWLFTTDADTELPPDFFNISREEDDAALIHPFEHIPEPGLEQPMQLYEISMLYYVAGLRWAGSKYAYPTIGSTISCSAGCYAAVRGFPKRNTGEDFHLLNKLRKTGDIRINNLSPIKIRGRLSDRVPVGTGQALRSISQLPNPASEFTIEHPDCFVALKKFLMWLNTLATDQPELPATGDPEIDAYSEQIGLSTHYSIKRAQSPSPQVMQKHLDDWFDALKTRQFIHHFRDQQFGRLPVEKLGAAAFLNGESRTKAIAAALSAAVFQKAPH